MLCSLLMPPLHLYKITPPKYLYAGFRLKVLVNRNFKFLVVDRPEFLVGVMLFLIATLNLSCRFSFWSHAHSIWHNLSRRKKYSGTKSKNDQKKTLRDHSESDTVDQGQQCRKAPQAPPSVWSVAPKGGGGIGRRRVTGTSPPPPATWSPRASPTARRRLPLRRAFRTLPPPPRPRQAFFFKVWDRPGVPKRGESPRPRALKKKPDPRPPSRTQRPAARPRGTHRSRFWRCRSIK